MFEGCSNLVSLNLSSFNTKSIKKIEGIFNSCINLDNVIFNNNEDSILIKNLYYDQHSSRSLLDLLPGNFFLFPVRPGLMLMPLPNLQTPVQLPVQTNTLINQTAPVVENPIQTVRTLPQRIVRNQLAPKYNNVELPAKVIQTRLAPTFSPPTPRLLSPSMPTKFSTQNITVPPVQLVTVPNALQSMALSPRGASIVRPPVIVPTQALCAQVPIANTPIMPKTTTTCGITSVGQNIPFVTNPVPMTVPYGNTFAPIITTTHGITPVGIPQYTNYPNSSMNRIPGLPNL
jgi:surface protein